MLKKLLSAGIPFGFVIMVVFKVWIGPPNDISRDLGKRGQTFEGSTTTSYNGKDALIVESSGNTHALDLYVKESGGSWLTPKLGKYTRVTGFTAPPPKE